MAGLPTIPWLAQRDRAPWCRTALAEGVSLEDAVTAVNRDLAGAGTADLALVFASASYASDLPRLLPLLQRRLRSRHWLGCLGGGVVGTGRDGVPHEREQQPVLSVMLLRLPGADLRPFAIDTTDLPDLDGPAEPWRALIPAISTTNGPGGTDTATPPSLLVFGDPASPGLADLISGFDYAWPGAVKLGGVAGQHAAGHGSLLFGEGEHGDVRSGVVGCLLGGSWRLEAVVAQGCRPIGPVYEVDQAQRNVVLQLSRGSERNSPVSALQHILVGLSPEEREQVRHSLFLGVGQSCFGLPSDGDPQEAFVVRNLIGVDPRNGAVAVAERIRVGQKVQFQLRDGPSSRQEARQLLTRQAARSPQPLAGLLFACLGRGQGLHQRDDGDVSLCREAFADLPIAGVFCNGEIAPIGGITHLHGYTAAWGFLVPSTSP
ncbi:MAG: FIST N-terminal domain-containing protein [Cyanobacteriota bacterium]|nr:FIST N-terminal domain-containing protein [Cyanobacteriota bacterium]